MMDALLGFLMLCGAIAVVVSVVRSMLKHWLTWIASVVGVLFLMMVGNILYYCVLGGSC